MRVFCLIATVAAMSACSPSGPATSGTGTPAANPAGQAPAAVPQNAAADVPPPSTKPVNYSPYPTKDFPDRVYLGRYAPAYGLFDRRGHDRHRARSGGGVSIRAR